MTFIDKKVEYSNFFSSDEMGFYKDIDDLLNQMDKLCGNIVKINKISRNGKKRYFDIFNNSLISDYIMSKTFNTKSNSKIIWD